MSNQFLDIGDDFNEVFPDHPGIKKSNGWLWGLITVVAVFGLYSIIKSQKKKGNEAEKK